MASLEQARRRFILKGGFHAVFLATPITSRITIDWMNLETVISKFCSEQPDLQFVVEYLGLRNEDLLLFRRQPPKNDSRDLRVVFYRRLYCSIILYNIVHEAPIVKVAEYMKTSRGDIQQLQKDASTHCGMAVAFARRLNWPNIASILESYAKRLSFGVKDELLNLVRMGPVMPSFRARAFYSCGYTNPKDIVKAKEEDILRILMECSPFEENSPANLIQKKATSSTEISDQPPALPKTEKFERLAKKIIHLAREVLKKDLVLLMTTSGMSNRHTYTVQSNLDLKEL